MSDSEARFARRLGFAVGRWDWWNLKSEHTAYEWALQQIADEIEPLDHNRDDMRAARHTIRLMACMTGADEESLQEELEMLRKYLPIHFQTEDDRTLSPEEAAQIKAG